MIVILVSYWIRQSGTGTGVVPSIPNRDPRALCRSVADRTVGPAAQDNRDDLRWELAINRDACFPINLAPHAVAARAKEDIAGVEREELETIAGASHRKGDVRGLHLIPRAPMERVVAYIVHRYANSQLRMPPREPSGISRTP